MVKGNGNNTHRGDPASPDDRRILQIVDFGRPSPGCVTLKMRNYWQKLHQGGAIPQRADIRAADLGNMTDFAFIAERTAPGIARFRLAGNSIVDLMGMEVRGMPVSSVIELSHRRQFAAILETVFAAPQIAEVQLAIKSGAVTNAPCGRLLLLPLTSDFGDVTRVLGCLIISSPKSLRPSRFAIASTQLDAIIAGGVIMQPQTSDRQPLPPLGTGTGHTADASIARQADITSPPHGPLDLRSQLRLITNDRLE